MQLICKFVLDSGHQLPDSEDLLTKKCTRPHGHRYSVEVGLDYAMLLRVYDADKFVDFSQVKNDVVTYIENLYDHKTITLTVEMLANKIKETIMDAYDVSVEDRHLVRVKIFETEKWGVEV